MTYPPLPAVSADDLFADPPAEPPSLADCIFYHCMDLPGLGVQAGSWDLRGHYEDYFGGHDFKGERVLDIGTSSGALAFEIERCGAREVVGFDLDEGLSYDCRLPVAPAMLAEFRKRICRMKNAFWLARATLRSNVKVAYGHAGHLPSGLGYFDTIVMGNILQHLQDPLGAVLQAVEHTNHLIITEADWLENVADNLPCMIMFDLPHPFSWYQVKPVLLQMILSRWGFTDQTLTRHIQTLLKDPEFAEDGSVKWCQRSLPTRHYTLSARRPTPSRQES